MEYLNLFSCCVPVKGYNRSVICDLQRSKYDFIPNELTDILQELQDKSILEVREMFDEEDQQTFDEYMGYLIDNEYAMLCTKNERQLFPKLSITWERPEIITNAIIDHGLSSIHDYEKAQKELDQLGCKALEMRFFEKIALNDLESILNYFKKSRLRHIDLIIKYDLYAEDDILQELCFDHNRVAFIVIHDSPVAREYECVNSNSKLIYITDHISNNNHCGIIKVSHFSLSIQQFTESHHFNSCLNRKISIDEHGLIKNCPSIVEDYGSFSDTSLIDVVKTESFQKLWKIKKDEIKICQDCEFRHICTDCRAFLEEPLNIYSKPLKCGYSPYTNKWEEWSKHPLKDSVISFYNF